MRDLFSPDEWEPGPDDEHDHLCSCQDCTFFREFYDHHCSECRAEFSALEMARPNASACCDVCLKRAGLFDVLYGTETPDRKAS